MSIEALTWAFKQPIKPSGAKFVLVALANMANERGEAYPSTAYLTDVTQQDRKSVIAYLDQLEAIGLIEDSGKRKGGTNQVKVYLVKAPINGPVKDSQIRNPSPGRLPNTDSKAPVFPGKAPKNGTRIPHEPTMNHHEDSLRVEEKKDPREEYRFAMANYGTHDERTKAAKIRMMNSR